MKQPELVPVPTLPFPPAPNRVPGALLKSAPVLRALERSREHLLSLQREDGHWCGVLEGDSILESEYLLVLYYLDKLDPVRRERLATRLRNLQQPQGGWAIYPGGPPEVSASVKAYFALKLAGDHPDAPHMVRARNVVLELGGLEAVNSFTRFYLALLGQLPWSACPAVPPELLMLPGWSPVKLCEMSAWSRTLVVPLSILWALRPVKQVPARHGISELSTGGRPSLTRPEATLPQNGWRLFFHGLDRVLKATEELRGFAPTRRRALDAAERWIRERLELSDGLGAIFPAMVYGTLALVALGYDVDGPVIATELNHLRGLELPNGDELRVQPCTSPVWDTSLTVEALAISGVAPNDPRLRRAALWLLDKEVRNPGDWRLRTSCEVSGWFFEYANEFYPDCDDTAQVVTTLSRLELEDRREAERAAAARRRGAAWLQALQNADGGWAAFDRECTRELLTCVPFADHNAMLDPSCADVTGRVMRALARQGVPSNAPVIRRAVRFLERTQESDGSWYGRWGCNYLYGTYLALTGLRACGHPMSHKKVQRAALWLRAVQNPDGGWGESYRSYDDPRLRGAGPSTASQTSWALLGLMATGDWTSSAVQRGVDYLLRTQDADGTWHDEAWTGTGFPRVFYLRYDLYDDFFPLMALGTWTREAAS